MESQEPSVSFKFNTKRMKTIDEANRLIKKKNILITFSH